MHRLRRVWLPVPLAMALVLLSGCRSGPPRAPVIGEAWVGPAVLKLRQEIPLDSPTAATVKHGDHVEIVQRRRRFMKVRTSQGAEGWTHENVLLSSEEMAALRALRERAAQLGAQGVATTFDALNVHTTPSRRAPSFMQVKQGERMQVLMHVVAPRVALERPPLIPPPPKKIRARKKPKPSRYPLPQPAPPPPPANWLELSKTNMPAPEEPPEPPPPVAMDDWSLVRTSSGQAGWVLTGRLFMAIPDEVAQYAEGHRITSYFSLGEVQDGDLKRHNWLWTTISSRLQDYDFDTFRVFIWSLRRHRFETAYVERRLKGWFPVRVHPVTLSTGGRTPTTTTYPGFSVCVEKEDGQRYRRDFAFIVNVVRLAGQGACEARPQVWPPPAETQVAGAKPAPAAAPPVSFFGRVKAAAASFTSRLLDRKTPSE